VGYFNTYGTASVFLPAAVTRLATVKIAPGGAVKVLVSGRAGLPATGISAGLVNLTATGGLRSGVLTGWADGASRPNTAVLSYSAGRTIASAALIPVGADGELDLYNNGKSPVTVIVDLAGAYYRAP